MNFYTLIFNKNTQHPKKWLLKVFTFVSTFSLFIFTINYIVDPYNITSFNLLKLKYKFARDDRTEKINHFKSLQKFDNILIGSSRVYSINPQTVSKILGGTTYNFGVGTATIEDHLGVLKYLIREKKVPKNIILGVDFYTFNPYIPPNSYFLRNKELNFLSYNNFHENYIGKFFSFDAFRASIRTIKYNFFKKEKPRFNKYGWAFRNYEDYSKRDPKTDLIYVKKEIEDNKKLFFSNMRYKHIDPKRVAYYEELKRLIKQYHITLYIFTTPLHPLLLNFIQHHAQTHEAMQEFLTYLSTFQHFTNLYYEKDIYSDLRNFNEATHTSPNAGDLILKKILR
jgi:hypothetical protein